MTDLPSPSVEGGEPTTPTGRSIIGQDYRGNEVYTITRAGILTIEAEASANGWNRANDAAKAAEAEARASEQAAPPLDVAQAIAFGIHRWRHPTKRMTDCDCQPYADSLADEYARLGTPSRSDPEPPE